MRLDSDRVAERPAEAFEFHLHDVTVGENDAFAEGKNIGPKEMNMNAARAAMSRKLEVMVFEICQAVAHILLSAGDILLPQNCAAALNSEPAMYIRKRRAHHQLRTKTAGAEFRAGEIE